MTTATHPLVHVKRLEAIEKAIRGRLGDIAELYGEVRRDRLYEAAGFDTPEAWAQARFGDRWVKLLTPEARKEIHAEKRAEGKSLRAIAAETGVDPVTVKKDVAGVESSTPARTIGIDGKSYPARAAQKGRWNYASTQNTYRKVLTSVSAFVMAVQELTVHADSLTADADDVEQIDAAISALRALKKQIQSKVGD